jgi:hypothetical protein
MARVAGAFVPGCNDRVRAEFWEGCARSIGPGGLIPKGNEVELDLVIATLQTFAVLFLACGVYLATHRTGGRQIPRPHDKPTAQIHSVSAH